MPVVGGVDSSTQSCTVELRDADHGSLLGRGRSPHTPTHPPVSEQAPAMWWTALDAALHAAADDAHLAVADIAAISVAAQCHGLVPLDVTGEVIRPAKLWNDTTSARQAEAMVQRLGRATWADAVGSVPTAAFTITKLAWLAAEEPLHLRRLAAALLPHDWITYRLTGRRTTDRSEASGTGYYAAHEQRWRPDLLAELVDAEIDWAKALPTVLGPSEPAGAVQRQPARDLGLRAGVVVGPGAGDQHSGALGLGLIPGQVAYSLGTSGVVLTVSARPVHDPRGWVNGVADAAGGYLPLVCTLNASKVTDAFARLLGVDHDELARLALTATAGPWRPVLAAYLDGERSPNRPAATGLLAGLTPDTSREDVARAAYEGVLLGLVRGHDAIRKVGAPADGAIVVTGGGARSPAYRQILADLLQQPVLTLDAPEATARGACIQAAAILAGADVRRVRDAWCPPTTSITEPRSTIPAEVTQRYLRLADWAGSDRREGPK